MQRIDADNNAYWNVTAPESAFGQLQGGARADVAIIGGGIVGVTLADLLKRAGRSVVLVDMHQVGSQVTGASTAKVTALHGLIYHDLITQHGEHVARAYAEVNQQAVDFIASRAAEDGIDCAIERVPAFTYSETGHGLSAIRFEAAAARRAGLPVEYVKEAPLPFAIVGAVRLDDQVQFHPTRYIRAIAAQIPGDGSEVFERTRALRIEEGNPHRVLTDRGAIEAKHVVLATHMPFTDRSLLFARAYPRAHVVLAARVGEDRLPGGMFISTDASTYSVRGYRDEQGPVLIATGPGYRPGHVDVAEQYYALAAYVREHFGADEVLNWWTNEDYDSMDRLPYIGRLARTASRLLVATGFSGWGLSNGTAAAKILADCILERPNPHARLFDAGRWSLRRAGKRFLAANLHVAREFVADRIQGWRHNEAATEIARGEGAIVRRNGQLVAVYKDEEGELHRLSANCTHLGCVVAWNSAEKQWECPCHGSRFDRYGRLQHGPAVRDLPARE